jgi:hypothetical protein
MFSYVLSFPFDAHTLFLRVFSRYGLSFSCSFMQVFIVLGLLLVLQ